MERNDVAALADPLPIEPLREPPDATVAVPGSKSLTNRALLASALVDGHSRLEGVGWSDDTEAMASCLRSLGAGVEVEAHSGDVVVHGTGGRWRPGPLDLDAQLSGTTARFVGAALALGDGPYRLDASGTMRSRPMDATFDALTALGARVEPTIDPHGARQLPATISGPTGERSHRKVTVAGDRTSQSLSGVLLVAPAWPGGLAVELGGPLVSEPYVDMTLSVMEAFGASVERRGDSAPGWEVAAVPYQPTRYRIEPDASAASYFFAAAALTGGRVRVEGLGAASGQGDLRFVDVLEAMGAQVARQTNAVEVHGTGVVHGVDVDLAALSDTAQTLAVVAPFADGPTRVRGIGFVRAKETDRIGAVVTELQRLGIEATAEDDGYTIWPGEPRPGVVRTYGDHRMAMAFALIGLRTPGMAIADPGCVAKTFPGYFTALDQLRQRGRGAGAD